ncbi:hypothetical protein K0038_04660 [Pseudomonas syringae]|nr:hypothetical protein [Pseudomonas syringae]
MRGKFPFNSTYYLTRRTYAGFGQAKTEVIVHSDTSAHKFSDDWLIINVAIMKVLKRVAVLVKVFRHKSD